MLFALPLILVLAAEPERADLDWWSLQSLTHPTPPNIANTKTPIDAFLRAKLQPLGLDFAPEADRMTLIRRVTFDLTGLPPTPEEIDAFLRDDAPEAYERLVERLLASPRYGERWARHWLDLARFGESDGFERDKLREHAWPYRDYVVRAFNADKPYADFVREQIAGDAIPDVGRDGVIATGFLVAGPFDEVAASTASLSVKLQARQDELEDMLAVVGQTFLGLTVNCARCHDHKFDPISQTDYYRVQAVFAGVRPGTRDLKSPEAEIARARAAELRTAIAALETTGRNRIHPDAANGPQPIARWTFDDNGRDSIGSAHLSLHGNAKIEKGRLVIADSGFARTEPLSFALHAKTLEAWVSPTDLDQRGGGVMTVESPDGRIFDAIVFGERQPRKWIAGSNNFLRTRDLDGPEERISKSEFVHLAVTYSADDRITIYRNGEKYGESYRGQEPVPAFKAEGARVLFGLRHTGGGNAQFRGTIDEARLYDRALSADEIRASKQSARAWVSAEQARSALSSEERQRLASLESELVVITAKLATLTASEKVYVGTRTQPEPVHFLRRGDITKKGDVMSPGALPAIRGQQADFGLPSNAPESARRRAFADWLASADNPLTWRVMVNRIWQHHFGQGLVGTSSDFGFNGERPSHPELLDWLAGEFLRTGGSIKALHRMIVTSSAYRQSSRVDPKARALDADGRLLWRFPPRRLEAEAVRDTTLFVAGQLDERMGGPSDRPFKLTVFNSNFYEWIEPEGVARRTVYRMNVNSARDPLLETLDCPDPSTKTPRRAQTTTPIQSLGLMNGVFIQRQSAALAERIRREIGDDIERQIDRAYRLTLGRPPRSDEVRDAVHLARSHGLREVCWVLLNASEFVYLK